MAQISRVAAAKVAHAPAAACSELVAATIRKTARLLTTATRIAMRNFAAVAFAVTRASLSAAKADVPGPDWMPMEQSHGVGLHAGY
jgi:RES domain-containing protein